MRFVSNQRSFILATFICLFIPFLGFAGPPFRTDDPGPVEYGHWEFYFASQIIRDNRGTSGIAPYGEVNYGISNWMHIHLNVPLCFNQPRGGKSVFGLGNIEFGSKCRLFNETRVIPQVGIYPVIEIPTGNPENDLGTGYVQFFIPLWLQKTWGPWTTYCGGGYMINITSNPLNSFFIGWEGQRDLSESITIGAEVFSTIFPSESSENELAFNIGTIVNFNDKHHFLFSMGRDIIGDNYFFIFAAYQLTI